MIESFQTLGQIAFITFGFLACLGALVMIAARSAVHSVLGFLFSMICVAACFLSLSAEFLGMAQLLVYAGGIVVLFLFVVMLVELSKFKEKSLFAHQSQVAIAFLISGFLLVALSLKNVFFTPAAIDALKLSASLSQGLDVANQNAQAVSRGLFAQYLLPFEVLSIILLVAMVGALTLAKTERV